MQMFLKWFLCCWKQIIFCGISGTCQVCFKKKENKACSTFRLAYSGTDAPMESNGFDYPADNDHYPQNQHFLLGKATFILWMDRGIRMVTCGIWRPVYLQFCGRAVVEDYFVHQQSVSAERAEVDNRFEINNISNHTQQAVVRVMYSYTGEPDKNVSRRWNCSRDLIIFSSCNSGAATFVDA